jgi:class 3 adenylate cyclase
MARYRAQGFRPGRAGERPRLVRPLSFDVFAVDRHSRARMLDLLRSWEEKAIATERIQRRLAAILAADVVGYSRLMAADEARPYVSNARADLAFRLR